MTWRVYFWNKKALSQEVRAPPMEQRLWRPCFSRTSAIFIAEARTAFSTASDLLKMAEYAIANPVFDNLSKLNSHVYYSLDKRHRKFVAYTHNRLLGKYEYAVGIKTGYTSKAGPCFIARAKKDGVDCVIVMLNSKENRWKTAKQIFEQVLNS